MIANENRIPGNGKKPNHSSDAYIADTMTLDQAIEANTSALGDVSKKRSALHRPIMALM
jgi:hypothetical protein